MSYSPSGLANGITFRRGQESVVVPIWRQAAGEYPFPDFRVLRDIYLSDPDMYSAVNFVGNRALSRGYHIECNPNVPNHEEAEEYLTDWLECVAWGYRQNERGFLPLLRIMARELAWGGTTILEMCGDPAGKAPPDVITSLIQVQLSSIWKFQRDSDGNLAAIWQYMSINPVALRPEKYIMFQWNMVDRNPFGYGLIHPVALAKPNMITGGTIPPLIAIKWQMEEDMRQRMHRYGNPRTIFTAKALSREEIKPMAEVLKDPRADFSGITNADVGIASDSPPGRMNFGPDLDYLDGRIKAATGNVLSEMLTGKGFSYASAVKAGSLADELVWDMQQVLKLNIEMAILRPVLNQSGQFDANLLKPKLEFNPPDPFTEFGANDLNALFQSGAISAMDVVRNLRKVARLDLDDPVQPQQPMGMQPQMPNAGQQPADPMQQLDPTAYQNLMQVQANFERIATWWARAREAVAVGGGAASIVSSPQKRKAKKATEAEYPLDVWSGNDYRLYIDGKAIDPTQWGETEWRKFLLWRFGDAGTLQGPSGQAAKAQKEILKIADEKK